MTADRPLTQRSAVTNRSRAFLTPGGEQTAVGLRWKDIRDQIEEDLGGANYLSEIERQLVRRCTQLSIEAERMEAERAKGGEIDIEQYAAITNALGRAAQRIGFKRRPRDVTPDLRDYIGANEEPAQ